MKGSKVNQYVVFKEDIPNGYDFFFRKGDIGKITSYEGDVVIVDNKHTFIYKKQVRVAEIDEIRLWLL